MGLTPNEILNKEFSTKFRGYDADQVNDYLDIIVADYEKMIEEIHQLKTELSTSKEKNAYFAQLQDSLNSSIVVAQEAADRLKQNARKEAELIIFEAEKEADRIVSNASDRARTIVTQTEALRRSSKTYRKKLQDTIQGQLDIVASEEYVNLFDAEIDSDLNPQDFKVATSKASDRVKQLEEDANQDFDQASNLIPEKPDHIFDEETHEEQSVITSPQEDTQMTESLNYQAASQEEDQDLEETQVFDTSELSDQTDEHVGQAPEFQEPAKRSESVLGQTIRIELPGDDK